MKRFRLPLLAAVAFTLAIVAVRVHNDPALRNFVDPRKDVTNGLAIAVVVCGPVTLIWLNREKARRLKLEALLKVRDSTERPKSTGKRDPQNPSRSL